MERHTMLQEKVSAFEEGEAMGPSPKKRYTVDTVSNNPLEASATAKGEGATVNQEAQVGMMEGASKSPEVYLQKCDEKQPRPVAGDAILPRPRESLPDDFLHFEDDDYVAVAGPSASPDHPASAASAPETPPLAARPHVPPLDPDVINYGIKCALMAEIRRYGRQYRMIFKLLEEVQGPLEVRLWFVKFTIKEAARFKRYHLIYYLEMVLDKLMSESTIRSNDLNLSA